MELNKELLNYLVCPDTKSPLVHEGDTLVSIDPETRRRYNIVDGIPVMLVKESEILEEDEWRGIMEKHGKLEV